MKIAFGGGGTAGHVIPALAVGTELKKLGHNTFYIGNANSIESRLSESDGFLFYPVNVHKLYRGFKVENLTFLYHLVLATYRAKRILKQEMPDAVFCTGGYVSGPVSLAALMLRIPLFCHESNSYPGLVTRTLAKYHTRIYVSFDSSKRYLSSVELVNFGIPIKASQMSGFSLASIGLNSDKPIILISGGSQGSLAINKAVDLALPKLQDRGYQIIWQTGVVSYDEFVQRHQSTPGLHMFGFSKDLPNMLPFANLAITRAGAMTIAELEEYRVPAILIPLPSAAENHQYFNALEQQRKAVAFLLEQSSLSSDSLLAAVDIVANDREDYLSKLNGIAPNRAAELIAKDLIDQINGLET